MTKLHFGCGIRYLPGYIHVDAQKYPHVDVVHDITQDMSAIFRPGSIDEIYACHVLEHVSRGDIVTTLCHWQDLLKIGGKLRIAVPDFEVIAHVYEHDPFALHQSLLGFLYGGQRDSYDYHTMTFDFESMQRLLEQVGFSEVQRYDWQEFLPSDFDDYSRTYLPHFAFETGKLMSLNVIATKIGPPLFHDKHLLSIITKKMPFVASKYYEG